MYSTMRDQCIINGEGFLCVFSIDNMKSFEDVESHRQQILNVKDTGRIPMILVGNKIYLPRREVDSKLAESYAKNHCMPFIETSAKTTQQARCKCTRVLHLHTLSFPAHSLNIVWEILGNQLGSELNFQSLGNFEIWFTSKDFADNVQAIFKLCTAAWLAVRDKVLTMLSTH